MWPELVIVHGKPRHPQSQCSIERSNGDIHDMLTACMRDNELTKWSTGMKFVHIQKNSALSKGIGRSFYEVLFGKCATIGNQIPKKILMTLEKEEDLIQPESVNDQPVTENETENILDASDIPEPIAEPNVEPFTSITDE
ncbi:KRAB-A domain-containing protein 2-like [Mytilus trossulus]|uniref:KRAB-A domain-containing protein 2-like n=1 Tax=Mytilus trossulus TaxID=6551 RepID=UPI003004FCD0